jgi:hypothetical protein
VAEEDLASAEEAEALNDAPENQADQTNEVPEPIVNLASELGWVPKDQFRGDPEKWRPADEFIRAGRDIQQTLSKELRSVKQEVERFGRVAAGITQDRVRQTEQHWQQKLAEAVDAGDHEAANQAVDQIKRVEQTPRPGAPPEVDEWRSRNPWFDKDPLAKLRAAELSDKLAKSGVTDVSEQLREVERAIRKEFPEHFPAKAKDPPATQTGHSRKAAPSNRAKGFADMPAESQQMAKDMVRRNPSVTLEAIAKSYWSDVANQGRA